MAGPYNLPTGSTNDTPALNTHPALHNDANSAINDIHTRVETLEAVGEPDSITLDQLSASAKADWEYVYAQPHQIAERIGRIPSGLVAFTWLLRRATVTTISNIIASTTNPSVDALIPFDPADFAAGPRTVQLRLRVDLLVNDVAPASDLTFDVRPMTASNGGADVAACTIGAAELGSDVTFVAPAANSVSRLAATFEAPVAGRYAIVLTNSATTAASSICTALAQLAVIRV